MQRWIKLFPHAPLDRTLHVWREIVQHYGESFRTYHNLTHIEALLLARDQYFFECDRVVEMAIWFHDLFYIPGDQNNELLSAHLARFWLTHLEEPPENIDLTCELILATKLHWPSSAWGDIMCDLDLLSLAAEPTEYNATKRRIRQEFSAYSDELWAMGRRSFIQRFLSDERSCIYRTTVIHDWFEQAARVNLENELYELS